MSDDLERIIKRTIREHGPLDIARYMHMALAHPQHGYYVTRDPLGQNGDFTTAPEISQLFGEMIGGWILSMWEALGKPERWHILECGPGRGTLINDAMRVVSSFEQAFSGVTVHLVEISDALIERQKSLLENWSGLVHWHHSLDEFSPEAPIVMVANEFFDALPFSQFQYTEQGWKERVVCLEDDGETLCFGERDLPQGMVECLTLPALRSPEIGDVWEFSLTREAVAGKIAALIKERTGAGLWIDYGHMVSAYGDTFQAMRDHKFSGILHNPGHSDLTSHVDFEVLARAAHGQGVHITGPLTQRDFLLGCGIQERLDELSETIEDSAARIVFELGAKRLIDENDMGALFKVLGIAYK